MIQSWLSYLPRHLADHLLAHPATDPRDCVIHSEAVALFADISGFTPMSEVLGSIGSRGTEELSRLLNQYFHTMLNIIQQYGGSVGKIAGDAVLAIFPFSPADRRITARRAIQCALQMQHRMPDYADLPTQAGNFSLAMKVGLGHGSLLTMTVGNPDIRLEYILAGAAIDACVQAEHNAVKGMVVADDALLAMAGIAHPSPVAPGYSQITHLSPPSQPLTLPAIPSPSAVAPPPLAAYLPAEIVERVTSKRHAFIDEHRPVSVLFSQFMGLDLRNTQHHAQAQQYLAQVIHIIQRYEGYLRQIEVGDKGALFIALFGAPRAHEDDAERALRCALEVQELSSTLALQTQMGIATGCVFCGLVGSDVHCEYAAIGDIVNTAARLMSASPTGKILVTETTRRAASEAFAWIETPSLTVKGKQAPLAVVALERRRQSPPTRLRAPGYTLPMIGRTTALALGKQLIAALAADRGHVLGITGEAGMGKSRLVAELLRFASSLPITYYTSECLSYNTQSPYMVWQPLLQTLFNLTPEQEDTTAIEHIHSQLTDIDTTLVERLPLLNGILGIDAPETSLTRSLDGKMRKNGLESLLGVCLRYWAKTRPLILILEDCHWLDDLSRDLLISLAEQSSDLPVLFIATYRPVTDAASPDALVYVRTLPSFHELSLTEFSAAEAAELIALKLGALSGDGIILPSTLVAQIHAHTQGNPFYMDELLNLIHEQGIDLRDVTTLEDLDLPDTVQRLLLSRIDRLPEAPKQVLKVASVIGRMFTASWLWEAYPSLGAPEHIREQLQLLSQHGFMQLERSDPELSYLFNHLLTREVAYESLSLSTRATLHEHIGSYIEQRYTAELDRYVNLLAYHYGASSNIEKQRRYFRAAALAAKASFAYRAAIGYYERLLPLLEGHERNTLVLELCPLYSSAGGWEIAEGHIRALLAQAQQQGDVHLEAECLDMLGRIIQIAGFPSVSLPYLLQARERFTASDDATALSHTLLYLGRAFTPLGQYDEALECLEQGLVIATAHGNTEQRAHIIKAIGNIYYYLEEYGTAGEWYEQGLAIARALEHRPLQQAFLSNLANVGIDREDYPQAFGYVMRSLGIAQQTGIGYQIELLLGVMGGIYERIGAYNHALACAQTKLLLNRRMAVPGGVGWSLNQAGLCYSKLGRYMEAEQLFRAGLAVCRTLKQSYPLVSYSYELAMHYSRQQRYAKAQAINDEALLLARQKGIRSVLFKTQLLELQLNVLLGQLASGAAISALNAMRDTWSAAPQQAAIVYAIWQIDVHQQAARHEAAERYYGLASTIHNIEYRERYETLTGKRLPDPPALPDPPSIVIRPLAPIAALIARGNEILAEQERIAANTAG